MDIFLDTFWYLTGRGVVAGFGLGALYGTLAFPIIGTVIGAAYGAFSGLLTGMGCGILAGVLTRWKFCPLNDMLRFQRSLILTCAMFTFAVAYISFMWLLEENSFPPALIAALASIYVTLGFTNRYATQGFDKPKRKEGVYA
jgi:hypothetical protein